ncbi:transposase [Trichonephila clavipes]|nr:transposase [Trichonephila clavipes]
MNQDSISAVMTIVFVCGDPEVNASILPLLYSDNTAPTAGVMVWGAIAYNTRSPLVLIRGTMTVQQYVNDILQPHVLPLMERPPGTIFQQDNHRPHTARVSQDCLRTVTTLPWPARSPDLSSIEHIWDHLGRRFGNPTSLNELEARLQQIWNEMSQDIIQNLYASVPYRIASCIRARVIQQDRIVIPGETLFEEEEDEESQQYRCPKRSRPSCLGEAPDIVISTGGQLPVLGQVMRNNTSGLPKSTFGLAIHQNDHQARRRFVEWAQNEIVVVPDFHKRILFSDEVHFWLNGYVKKQNCHIWSEANPQVYVETPLHPEKLTVWCALWAGGIIGPYFFKNDEGHNVTVNGDRYRNMITNFFIPELNNHDVQELWFQQDGATCHTARATIDLLKDTFGDRLISRFGPVNWPPKSCDLTPLDYFLWVYVKSLVYADKPQTLDHFEDNIRRVIADIRPQMLEKVIENWTSRLDYIRASRGSHMPEIIFKM